MVSDLRKKRVLVLALKILLITFGAEVCVMVLFPYLTPKSTGPFAGALIDAGSLTALLSPFVWLFIVKPISEDARREVGAAEAVLWEQKERLRTLIDASPLAILSIDPEGTVRDWNVAAEKMFGWTAREAVGSRLPFILPEHEREFRDLRNRVLDGGSFTGIEALRTRKDGSSIPVSISAAPLADKDGRITGIMGIVSDLTRVREAEESILRSEHDWEDTFNTITDIITVHDKDFNIIRANRAAQGILDLPVLNDDPVKCYQRYHGTGHPPQSCPSCICLVSGEPSVTEMFEPHLNRFLEVRAIPRLDERRNIVGLIHVVRDISDRKRMEEALTKSENRLRTIIETVPECVMLLSTEASILELNPAGLVMFGADSPDQIAGKSIYPLIVSTHRSAFETLHERVFKGGADTREFEIDDFKGIRHWVTARSVPLRDPSGTITALLAVIRDVTEQKKLEAQLRHAQKMEAIGTLTGGIAHDFNNILTAIIGYANILKLKIGRENPGRPFIDQILASAERATSLTQSLLAFSRRMVTNLRPVVLAEIVQRGESLLRRLIGEDIELKSRYEDTDTTIVADSGQIEQVLMNLAANARDAMPAGGTLAIRTDRQELDNEFIRTHGYGKPGIYATVALSDTGSGMDEATRDRIFEPFFTTKEVGKGTGLGLSIVYGIVKSHNGFITCASEPGRGTSFTIYLPRVKARRQDEPERCDPFPQGGTETILVAEDDEEVRNLTTAILKDFGYTIIEADNGESAVQRFLENRRRIGLLLFDVIMPRKNGKDAYDAIRCISPESKILFVSGYATSTRVNKGIVEAGFAFILKPVSPDMLLRKIREVLDR